MKKIISSLLLVAASTVASADDIVSAELLAQSLNDTQSMSIGKKLRLSNYDGPYNGELPVKPCSINEGSDSCLDYKSVVYGENAFENVSVDTTQEIEDYIFYNAYLNVLSGYYSPGSKEFTSYVKKEGRQEIVLKEIFMLKSGQKPITLRTNQRQSAKGIY